MFYKTGGFIYRDHPAFRCDKSCQIITRISGAAADIENSFSSADACPFPDRKRRPAPELVLHTKPHNLRIMCSEGVFSLIGLLHRYSVLECYDQFMECLLSADITE